MDQKLELLESFATTMLTVSFSFLDVMDRPVFASLLCITNKKYNLFLAGYLWSNSENDVLYETRRDSL